MVRCARGAAYFGTGCRPRPGYSPAMYSPETTVQVWGNFRDVEGDIRAGWREPRGKFKARWRALAAMNYDSFPCPQYPVQRTEGHSCMLYVSRKRRSVYFDFLTLKLEHLHVHKTEARTSRRVLDIMARGSFPFRHSLRQTPTIANSAS